MKDFGSIQDFINRAAHQAGFEREKFVDQLLPTVTSKIAVVLSLGDMRGQSLMSALLLNGFMKACLQNKYVVLCSFPGYGNLFPYVQEYWSVADSLSLRDLVDNAIDLDNKEGRYEVYARSLRRYFENVYTIEDFHKYWKNGFTTEFFAQPKEFFYPEVPTIHSESHKKIYAINGKKMFIYPCRVGKAALQGMKLVKYPRSFWIKLCEKLLSYNIVPVIYETYSGYELASTMQDRCAYVTDRNIISVMSAMRATGCVLDVFSGLSRLAIQARVPFVSMVERQHYFQTKDYEFDDLGDKIPHKYIFYFPTMIENSSYTEAIEQIANNAKKFFTSTKLDLLPAPVQNYKQVFPEGIRERKRKRLGMRYIKVERLRID